MATQVGNHLDRSIGKLPCWTSPTAFPVGLAVLVGKPADLPWVGIPLPGLVTMKPNTSLAFILLGVSLRLFHSGGGKAARARVGARVPSLGPRIRRSEGAHRPAEGLP